jgi:4-amino-4-deoxy-L-arabinose transferase-like glycosyltransferase
MSGTRRFWFAVGLPYAVIATCWSLVVPTWEAPDEQPHLLYARYVARWKRLPVQEIGSADLLMEGHQPPLYYVLIAPLAGRDSRVLMQDPDFPQSPTAFLHGREEVFPFTGVAARVHLLRLLSVGMALGMLLIAHRLARAVLWPDENAALLAVAWCAFLPQFTYVMSSVNNDVPAALLGTLSLFLLVVPRRGRAVLSVLAGAVVGLAVLAKTTTLFLVPLGVLIEWRTRRWQAAAAFAAAVVAVSGWWFARNIALYGDLFAWKLQVNAAYAVVRPERLSAGFVREMLVHLFRSYWGAFGDGARITLAPSLYCALAVLCALAVAGAVRRFGARRWVGGVAGGFFLWIVAWPMARRWLWHWIAPGTSEVVGSIGIVAVSGVIAAWLPGDSGEGTTPRSAWWMLWAALASFGAVLVFNLRFPQAQGRFLFPAVACHGILAAYGLRTRVTGRRGAATAVVGLGLFNIAVLVLYVYRTFQGWR